MKVHDENLASTHGSFNNIFMNGSEVFKFAVRAIPTVRQTTNWRKMYSHEYRRKLLFGIPSISHLQVIQKALLSANLCKDDIDWLVLHQANQRILDAAAQRLGVPAERVISNVAEYGNTSAASIPLALDEAVRAGKIKPGSRVSVDHFLLPSLILFTWKKKFRI